MERELLAIELESYSALILVHNSFMSFFSSSADPGKGLLVQGEELITIALFGSW